MNKGAIQRFAIWARNELIAQVSQRAYQYGITKEGCGEQNAVTVGGRALTADEQKQRKELVDQIRSKGYTQVMEEVAYTWFNRFIALRFMEVNNYLPSHIRVFSDSTGTFKPEILNDVLHLALPGLNRERVAEYIESNDTEALYRYLLLTQCNAMNESLPRMFEKMGGFTELLLPNNILKQDGVLGRMVSDIPEEDWTDQVQIIGWLYQYYNSELKDDTFALLKKNVKITKERIPSATQLFTPDWIVRYMVENSLGRIYVDKRKSEGVYADGRSLDEMTWSEAEAERIATEKLIADKMGWKYYLPEAEQTQDVRKQLDEIQAEYANLDVKDIKVIDPCMGSGHILVYAFDVLMQIYEANGYSQRDAAQSILENNLYGLDIDDRAAQLAYFAVMMKARQYDRRIFTRGIQPNIYSIRESNGIQAMTIEYFHNNDPKLRADIESIVTEMRDAKEYGSILNITPVDFAGLYARFDEIREDINMMRQAALDELLPLVKCAELLAQKYDVVVTNPPYMGSGNMNGKLASFIKEHYPNTKADLFSACMERGLHWAKKYGYTSMITMESWMFLSSFEQFRTNIINGSSITSLVHMPYLGKGGTSLGISFGTVAFVISSHRVQGYCGDYSCIRYYETDDNGIPLSFPVLNERRKHSCSDTFLSVPGGIIAYWISDEMKKAFQGNKIGNYLVTREGMATANNDLFLRLWYELPISHISFNTKYGDVLETEKCWVPYNKGGEFRKWYGNNDYVVNWRNDGFLIRNNTDPKTGRIRSHNYNGEYAFQRGITWSALSSAKISVRYCPEGYLFDSKGAKGFAAQISTLEQCQALINSCVGLSYLEFLSPTIDFKVGDIIQIPYVEPSDSKIEMLTEQCIKDSRNDWDSYETSWDFKRNPLV